MLPKSVLKRVIMEAQEGELPRLVRRDLRVDLGVGKAIALVGPRRAGKTFFLYQVMGDLIKKGVERERIVYINFEDERIMPFRREDFSGLLDSYYELYPEMRGKRVYFFLDEVQNTEGWEVAVRRFQEREGIQVFITGSSSKLLSEEISTSLRGRTLLYEIQPFSFLELLRARGIEVGEREIHSSARYRILKYFEEYMRFGGFPEVVMVEDTNTKIRILQEYLRTIYLRDIIDRYSVRNRSALRDLIRYVISHTSQPFTLRRYHRAIKQLYPLGIKTLQRYLDYLQDVRLAFFVEKYGKLKEQMRNPKKVYLIDVGFRHATGFYTSEDLGILAENVVFLRLRERSLENPLLKIYYYKGRREVDFVVVEGKDVKEAIQVSWELDLSREREYEGAVEAAKKLKLDRVLILTLEEEGEENIEGITLEVKPLWKWLLGF
ncbi:MAG: ATP-binding protein [Thermoplasmata archaeon]|nr:MAG: ATP-binding protein [Thermoplasmata archaeon]